MKSNYLFHGIRNKYDEVTSFSELALDLFNNDYFIDVANCLVGANNNTGEQSFCCKVA